ncbi:MAG: hypothetical protein ABI831_01865 [Betaproteobacteria bacterium]
MIVLPAFAALLPWRAGFALLSRLARSERLYGDLAAAALSGAQTMAPIPDPLEWKRRYRLIRLVDHCDLFLVRTRSMRWLERNVDVEGVWPDGGPFIAMTFHWGAGMWAFAHLHRLGFAARMLVARHDKKQFRGDWIACAYAELRNGTVEKAGGAAVIPTGGASAIIASTLASKDIVVALYDVPAALTGSTVRTRVCGRPIDLPAGLAKIAIEAGVPVVPFSMGLDYRTGRRLLHIEQPFRPGTVQQFADHLAASLTRLIDADLAAWHFSSHAVQFFASEAGVPVAAVAEHGINPHQGAASGGATT